MSYKFANDSKMYKSPTLKRVRSDNNLQILNNMVISKDIPSQLRYIDFVDTDFEYYDNNRFLNSELIKRLQSILTPYQTENTFYISKKRMGQEYGYKFVLLICTYNYIEEDWFDILDDLNIYYDALYDVSPECLQSEYILLEWK